MNIENIIRKIGRIKKIKKKWIVIIIIVLAALGYFIMPQFFKSPTEGYVTEKVSRGEVSQEVSETGSVEATNNISLGFKSLGKISKIYVAAGQDVKAGDVLAELDSNQLYSQLRSAQAALEEAKIKYDKLLNGSTKEDIKTYQNLVDSAKNDLQTTYDSALNTLKDANIKIYNAYTVATSIQSSYFNLSDQPGIKVLAARGNIDKNIQDFKSYLKTAEGNPSQGSIDSTLSYAAIALDNVYNDLKIIREQCDEGIYYFNVSSADKTSLDNQKSYVNTALTNVISAKNSISSYKIALQKAEDNLNLETAAPRPEDIDIYQAQVEQARANVDLYQTQLNDNHLRSPVNGKITNVNVKIGEIVSASQSVANLLSSNPFEIKANIYEEDIVKIKIEDTVEINLIAFPFQTFSGKVIAMNPGEKIIDNVVYYEITIDFPGQPENILSGMTADIVVGTNKKEDVLRAPKPAVETINGGQMVQVVKNGKIEDQIITTGLEGNDYYEDLSGLNEGDEIVTGKK